MIRFESFLCTCQANYTGHQLALQLLPQHNSPTAVALLDSVRVFTIFWGQAWQTSPNSDLANQLNQFFGFVVSSSLVDQLAEYGVPGQTIGHGSYIGTAAITQPTLSHSVTDAAIQNRLEQEIKSNSSVPKPDANTLYFIYLPPGTAVV